MKKTEPIQIVISREAYSRGAFQRRQIFEGFACIELAREFRAVVEQNPGLHADLAQCGKTYSVIVSFPVNRQVSHGG